MNGNPITVPKILAGDHMTSRQFHRWKLVTTVCWYAPRKKNSGDWTGGRGYFGHKLRNELKNMGVVVVLFDIFVL